MVLYAEQMNAECTVLPVAFFFFFGGGGGGGGGGRGDSSGTTCSCYLGAKPSEMTGLLGGNKRGSPLYISESVQIIVARSQHISQAKRLKL